MTEYKYLRSENIIDLPTALFRSIERNPARDAIEYLGKTFTYHELGQWAKTFAHMLLRLSKNRDDRIALFTLNTPQFIFGYFGALLADRIVVPVNYATIAKKLIANPLRSVEISKEIRETFFDARPSIILVADVLWPILSQLDFEAIGSPIIIFTGMADFLPAYKRLVYPVKAARERKRVPFPKRKEVVHLRTLLKNNSTKDAERTFQALQYARPLDQIVHLQYTTGTSGSPKGVEYTHENLVVNTLQCREHFGELLEQHEAIIGALPFCHAYGLTACMNFALLALEGKLIVMPKFDEQEVLRAIEEQRVRLFLGVPPMFTKIAQELEHKRYDLPEDAIWVSGAGRIDQATYEKIEKSTGIRVCQGYGLSEASPVVSVLLPGEHKPGSIGQPLPLTIVQIIDTENGKKIQGSCIGEAVVTGPQVARGYYKKPDATAKKFKHGRLYTGDLLRKDINGHLYFIDRLENMAKRRGEKIYAPPIESFLKDSPVVQKCAVIFRDDPDEDQVPVAFVVLKNDATLSDLAEHLKTIPDPLWKPAEIIDVDPATFAQWEDVLGKVSCAKVHEHYLAYKNS